MKDIRDVFIIRRNKMWVKYYLVVGVGVGSIYLPMVCQTPDGVKMKHFFGVWR